MTVADERLLTEKTKSESVFVKGMQDGLPIALGYFAVSFSLGIAMKKAGMNAFQGFLLSITNLASAGEYADTQVILEQGAYLEIILATLVANLRYILMSAALSQRLKPSTGLHHRFAMAYGITDEIFAIAIAQNGHIRPSYMYGAVFIAAPAWGIGTALGILAGSILPVRIVSALSAALYGMFLAIIIPPCRKDRAVALAVVISFAASYLCSVLPLISDLSSGMRTIILTVVISSIFAVLFPHKEAQV